MIKEKLNKKIVHNQYSLIFLVVLSSYFLKILSLQGLFSFIIYSFIFAIGPKKNLKAKVILYITIGLIFYYFSSPENKLEIFTISTLFVVDLIYKNKIILNFEKFLPKKLYEINISKTNAYFLIFLLTLLTQNAYLNFETIDWDINSYLVASQNISLSNLPYETQWESKQPLLYFIYKLFIYLADGNLVMFKILNDSIIFILSIFLFKTINREIQNNFLSLLGTLLFLFLMSTPWANAEYSEIYCLLFIVLGFHNLISNSFTRKNLFFSGIFLGCSLMINIGSAILIFPIMYFIKRKDLLTNTFIVGLGIALPTFIFFILYSSQNLVEIFLETTFYIPLNYPSSNNFSQKIIIDFFRSYFEYNKLLFCLFLTTIYIIFKNYQKINVLQMLLLISSILFVVVASHGYYHHYLFFIYFFALISSVNLSKDFKSIFIVSIFIILFNFSFTLFPKSLNNLTNISNLHSEYPLFILKDELQNKITSDTFSILATDYQLINFYFEQDNFSYIIHPTNLEENFIIDKLTALGLANEKEISWLISNRYPDVVICSEDMKDFNCEVSDYDKNYVKIMFDNINSLNNINYYSDPYKNIRVYIKKEILR